MNLKRLVCVILLLALTCLSVKAQWDKDVISFRGRKALQEGKFGAAIEQFNMLAQIDTSDYWNYFYRGIAKYNLGDLRGAHNDFNRSVKLNPVFTNGYHYRAITESRFGLYDDALTDLQRALELRPGNEGLYFSRGVTYFLAQRFDEALADFNRYIQKNPKDAPAYLNRGATNLFLKDTTAAINDYDKAIELDRRDAEGYIRRGRIHADRKRYDLAVADMSKAIEIDPQSTIAYFTRGMMYYERYFFNDAMKDFNKILEIDPNNALTLYNRSLLFAQIGNFGSALKDMDKVLEINPDNVLAHYNRATYYINLNRLQDALNEFTRAIEIFPDFAKAYMSRSSVNLMLGRQAASKSDYQIAERKIAAYKAKGSKVRSLFEEDGEFSSLLTLDSDFSKKDFNEELLQNRDVDAHLKPLYCCRLTLEREEHLAFSNDYENFQTQKFLGTIPVSTAISNHKRDEAADMEKVDRKLDEAQLSESEQNFVRGLAEVQSKNFNKAMIYFDLAIKQADDDARKDKMKRFFKGFYLLNRGVLKAEMAEFLSDMGNNVQTLKMDDKGITRARLSDHAGENEGVNYDDAIADMTEALKSIPGLPFAYYDLGNLFCMQSKYVEAIENYDKALKIHPEMADAYFNRGLVLIMVKDKEKGCIDLSRAGELGIKDAYSLIGKYCKTDGKD